jgi:hypothetical protein
MAAVCSIPAPWRQTGSGLLGSSDAARAAEGLEGQAHIAVVGAALDVKELGLPQGGIGGGFGSAAVDNGAAGHP